MDADFSIELGSDDPVLDVAWTDPSGQLVFIDLKRHPELLSQITEVRENAELAEFLRSANSTRSPFITAKCDVWATGELSAEEEIFAANYKFVSYVDLVFSDIANRRSFSVHDKFVKALVALLRRAPEIPSSVEVCVRRCFWDDEAGSGEGFYFTLYVNGYGADEAEARKNWAIGINLASNAMVQVSAKNRPL